MNTLVQCILIICITLSAIHFENPCILWFYILALVMGILNEEMGGV